MAERPRPHALKPDEHQAEADEVFASWVDLFEPMILPDRYRLLLQLGKQGLISDQQAERLAVLWGRRET